MKRKKRLSFMLPADLSAVDTIFLFSQGTVW